MTSQAVELSLHYLNELADESTVQVAATRDLLINLYKDPPPNEAAIAVFFVEVLWSNYRILQLVTLWLKDVPKDQEVVQLALEPLKVLQSLLMNREVALVELNRLSYSLSVH